MPWVHDTHRRARRESLRKSLIMSEDRISAETAQAAAWLDEAHALHDLTPESARDLLRRIVPAALPRERRAQFAYLVNRVAGGTQEGWAESLIVQQALIDAAGDAMDLAVWQQASVAAHLAGDEVRRDTWLEAMAGAARTSAGEARALLALAAACFTVPGQSAVPAGREALRVLQPLANAPLSASLDAAFAMAADVLGSHLAQRPLDDLRHPDLRSALDLAAHIALRCWTRGGGWVLRERAHYLCALAANALGDGERGLSQACAGLALMDLHDPGQAEVGDRAFLELEQGQALWLVGRDGAAQAEVRARALAERFAEGRLRQAFAARLARNEDLRTQQLRRLAD